MRIRYPKLRNMTHTLPLRVFIAFKGTNLSFLFSTKFHCLKTRVFNRLPESIMSLWIE